MQLHVITDTTVQHSFTHLQLAEFAVRGGADWIQFRETNNPGTAELARTAKEIRKLCRDFSVKFIVNNRVDIAWLVEADGVHLGQEDLPIPEARKILGPGKTIGATAGNLEEALLAEKEGANYIGYGHIFPTTSKKKETPPTGIAGLKEVRAALRIPVFAIGGITLQNVKEVLEANPAGVAVIHAIAGSPNPEETIKNFKEILHDLCSDHRRF